VCITLDQEWFDVIAVVSPVRLYVGVVALRQRLARGDAQGPTGPMCNADCGIETFFR
jgi:hypothetical protein